MKYIKTYEIYSDEEIENMYSNFRITFFKVDNINIQTMLHPDFDDGSASGGIEIAWGDYDNEITRYDNWIRYDSNPSNISFDHWYPAQISSKLKEYINKGIEDWKIKRDAEKYNL